ncbi:MAG: tetratricopeptide repeat protein [Usitatibacter sp.]
MIDTPFARRNDPCPCGSGLKYKACHGKLEAGPPPAKRPRAEESLRNGVDAMRAQRLDEALAWFDGVLAADPANLVALHYKGYVLCQKGEIGTGVELLERVAASAPGEADFHARLGLIRYVMAEPDAAVRSLERAIALAPRHADAHSNLALALRDRGDFERALEEARRALEIRPDLPAARLNLALVLLALGRFEEAWPALSWRPDPRVNLRDPAVPNAHAHSAKLPPLEGHPAITLHGEQGLGDTLFFLRFAPLAAARGARLRFWGDARLAAMLTRSGVVDEALPGDRAPADLDASRLAWVGDLPALLAVGGEFPPPLALTLEDRRVESMRARLSAAGPAPYIALTWRAGLERRGKAVLVKAIAPQILGRALAGRRATFVSVQRDPAAGEARELEAALGVPVHDFSASNGDLDDMLALMSLVDDYVGVSNTNTHLRAAVSRKAAVLVPYPPEWRWGAEGDESPWFPGFELYRAAREGSWDAAMRRLAARP